MLLLTDDDGMDWDGSEQVTTKKEYDCVICSQTSPSTDDKPMGLAVLVQVSNYQLETNLEKKSLGARLSFF